MNGILRKAEKSVLCNSGKKHNGMYLSYDERLMKNTNLKKGYKRTPSCLVISLPLTLFVSKAILARLHHHRTIP